MSKEVYLNKVGLVQRVKPRSDQGRIFVVGDLHGCYETFMEKLVLVGFDFEHDLVIAVGDICDRGRGSLQCVGLLEEPWFVSIKGNHEDFCVMGSVNEDIARVHKDPRNGGAWFYDLGEVQRREIAQKFYDLPLAIEVEYKGSRYGFTHADMPFQNWEDLYHIQDPQTDLHGRSVSDWLMWSRFGYDTPDKDTAPIEGVRALFHGHCPSFGKIEKRGNELYVDFGECFGYDLCVIELNEACEAFNL